MSDWMWGNKYSFKHGLSHTREYESWHQMRNRCLQSHNKDYANYGGRGIKICERWAEFANFLADMGGSRPAGMTLERRDVDGDYTPDNCYWASVTVQNRNKRTSIRVFYECQWMTLKEACRAVEVSYPAIWHRMKRYGLTFVEALAYQPIPNDSSRYNRK